MPKKPSTLAAVLYEHGYELSGVFCPNCGKPTYRMNERQNKITCPRCKGTWIIRMSDYDALPAQIIADWQANR